MQPKIHQNDIDFRNKINSRFTHPSANPDLLTEYGNYIEVKSPNNFKNINGLAVMASKKQNAEALITDKNISIDASKINQIAHRIFIDANYKKDVIHFLIKGKYYSVHR